MYKTNLVCLALLLIPSFSFSQVRLSDDEENLIAENDFIKTTTQDKNNILTDFSSFNPPNTPSIIVGDIDDDGMDDNWEIANGLDPSNPKDAWEDADDDTILNLFEFQLETNPNDGSSPIFFEVTPSDGADVLEDMIRAAENDIRVIRLSQGNYAAEVLAVFYENFSVMLQGGWNDGFTIHDSNLYTTTWVGTNDEALNILIPIGNETISKSTVILEGIHFTATNYFSLGGAARVSLNSGNAAISIYNCSMINSTYYGLALGHKNQLDSVTVFIVNTVISNNLKGGIYTQVTNEANSRWRIFNTTINNPESQEGGIDGLTSGEGKLAIEFTNSINWGNNTFSFNFSSFHQVEVLAINSNIDITSLSSEMIDFLNTIDSDPLFQNVSENDWTLLPESPCIDAGVDVGLAFGGIAPDMGALETEGINAIGEKKIAEKIHYFPNPVKNILHLDFEKYHQNLKLELVNLNGKKVAFWKFNAIQKVELDISVIPNGFYFLNTFSEEGISRIKFIKT